MTRSITSLALCIITCCAGKAAPLKVFILAGEHEMVGYGNLKTIPHAKMDPATKPTVDLMLDEAGNPRTSSRVWISYLGPKKSDRLVIKEGPLTSGYGALAGNHSGLEFSFGLTLEQRIKNPILIIKTAWQAGGLHDGFRPPSATITGSETREPNSYDRMISHIKDTLNNIQKVHPAYNPKDGYELAGFVWFQGWNDMLNNNAYENLDYSAYTNLLASLMWDVSRDLKAPNLPWVIGVSGVGGKIDGSLPPNNTLREKNFRNATIAAAKLPYFESRVTAVLTENYWDDELHHLVLERSKLQNQTKKLIRKKKWNKDRFDEELKKLIQQEFTDHEVYVINNGVLNLPQNYYGSMKIISQIGVAFADALVPPTAN